MILHKAFKDNIYQLKNQKRHQFQTELIPSWFEKAAVLILFWDEDDTIRVVLTERSAKVKSHKGEVSFPGGRVEPGENLMQAALREAEEEIGINPNQVNILGQLDEAWSRAAYQLTPFVGWYEGIPEFTPNADEVGKILTPDLETLFDESNRVEKTVEGHGMTIKNTTIKYQDSIIFGLTADLLIEALEQGMGKYEARGNRREISLQSALKNKFFTYQKSEGNLPPQSDLIA